MHERDPDSACTVRVFLDGVEVTDLVTVQDVDPGAGAIRSEWDEATEDLWRDQSLSKGFRHHLVAARDFAASNSEYIEDDEPTVTIYEEGASIWTT